MTEVLISKLDAAKRQLEMAIRMFLGREDIVSTHTLAAAAHMVLKDLCNKQKISSAIKDEMVKMVRPEKQKEFGEMMNKAENFFKHADRDPDALLKFNGEQTEWFLWDICAMYKQLTKETTPIITVFDSWFTSKHPQIYADAKFVEFLQNEIKRLNINHENRQEFLDLLSKTHKIK